MYKALLCDVANNVIKEFRVRDRVPWIYLPTRWGTKEYQYQYRLDQFTLVYREK